MTNTYKIAKLMADGAPRSKHQIAEQTGLEVGQVERAIAGLRKRGHAKARPVEYVYEMTDSGLALANKVPLSPELLARKRAERAERARMARLRDKANARIAEELDRERAERAAEKAEFRRMKAASRLNVYRAVAGAIPNSVFALGAHA